MTKTDIINALPNIRKTWEIAHERACAFVNGIKEIYSKYDTAHIYSVLGSNYVVSDYIYDINNHRFYLTLINEDNKSEGFTYRDYGESFSRVLKVAKEDFLTMILDKTDCHSLEEFIGKYDITYILKHINFFADILKLSNDEIYNLMNKEHLLDKLAKGLGNLSAHTALNEKKAEEKFFAAFGGTNKTYKSFRVKVTVEEITH